MFMSSGFRDRQAFFFAPGSHAASLGLLPRPCVILLEEGMWGVTTPQTDEFPLFHTHSASEDTAKQHSELYVFQ
jgi:hypothetical protein